MKRLSYSAAAVPAGVNTSGPLPALPRVATTVPRIAVVGLLANQQNEVQKAIGNKADLRFISRGSIAAQLPPC